MNTNTIITVVENKVAAIRGFKCANSTLCGYAQLINMTVDQKDIPMFRFVEVYLKTNLKEFAKFPIRFCIVRDPVDRFLSGYTNKLLPAVQGNMTIDQLLSTIDEPEFKAEYGNFLRHVNPLTHFYGTDPDIFTHIFDIHQMAEVKLLLERESGRPLPNMHRNRSIFPKPTLTETQRKSIMDRYQQDYDIYGKWMQSA